MIISVIFVLLFLAFLMGIILVPKIDGKINMIKVAVMGCVVNGPGEAKEADLGVAGGIGEGLLIKHGEIVKKLPEDQLLPALKEELDHWS